MEIKSINKQSKQNPRVTDSFLCQKRPEKTYTNDCAQLAINIAHDLRSPLAALQMTLQNSEGINPIAKQMLELASRRISEISNDLLQCEHEENAQDLTRPATISNPIVLVDNDPIVRMLWQKSAEQNQITLHTFADPQTFLESSKALSPHTKLFIDVNLGEKANFSGISFSKTLSEMGFLHIFLCTGYKKEALPSVPWVQDIMGKIPPWVTSI